LLFAVTKTNSTGKRMDNRAKSIVQTALFVALCVALGFLLAEVPNVELMTVSVFLSGVVLGMRRGCLVGVLSILCFSLFNPYGPPLPPLLAAQIAGYALVGISGGIMRGRLAGMGRAAALLGALAGLVLTLVYDALTTVATAIVTLGPAGFLEGLAGFFAVGALFVIVHALSNTIVFAVAVVPVLRAVTSWERGRSG
jgi:uncharacterized membrane protein